MTETVFKFKFNL